MPELLHMERQRVDSAQNLAGRGQLRSARSGPTYQRAPRLADADALPRYSKTRRPSPFSQPSAGNCTSRLPIRPPIFTGADSACSIATALIEAFDSC